MATDLQFNRIPNEEEMKAMGLPVSPMALLQQFENDTVSTNILIDEEDSIELEGMFPLSLDTPEEMVIRAILSYHVKELLEDYNFDEREMEISMFRYDFYDGNSLSLQPIGIRYHLTKKRWTD